MHDGIYKSGLVYGIRYCYFGCYNARYNNGCCKRYLREEDINAVVWNAIQTLAAFTEQASAKAKRLEVLDYSKNEMLVAEMAKKQKQVEKCSMDKFSNVEAFMSGRISKEVYQKKRTELDEMAVSLTQEIQDMEEQLHRLELGTNSELDDAVENLSAISGEKELTRELVGS